MAAVEEITQEDKGRAKARVTRILYGIEANPFVPLEKTGKSWGAWVLGLFVTIGNALNNAGQAFFSLGGVAGAPIGGVAAAGTFTAMVQLYGDSVFPAFQTMLTRASQEEEYIALLEDLKMAQALGFHQDRDRLQAFLRQGFEERRHTLARKKLRQLLREAKGDSKGLDIDSLSKTALEHAKTEAEGFFGVLKDYFSRGKKPVLQEAMTDFFTGVYQPSASAPVAPPAGEGDEKIDSLFAMEVKTLVELKQLKADNGFTLDLESAFTEVSTFQQWLWVKRLLRETDQQAFETEKAERIAQLKTALGVASGSNQKVHNAIQTWEAQALRHAGALTASFELEANEFFLGADSENQPLRAELRRYRKSRALQAYNSVFQASRERAFYVTGYVIGTFGALGNAALGYVGLMALIKIMGLSAIPAAWVPILIFGMLTGFFSSFLMTRLRIIDRLMDFGRYLDKRLPVENRRLRYTALVLGGLGSVAPAYFAFYAGKMLIIGFAGAGSVILVPALIVGLVCGVATFFGAGALMVESLYDSIRPYILISEDSLYQGWLERLEMMARLFFFGQRKREEIGFERILQATLARSLGLVLLVGAVASQIQLGLAPLVIVGSIFAAIGMLATYSGVFVVAEKAVERVFAAIKWCITTPGEGAVVALLSLAAAASLELSITAAVAWISNAAFLGIGAAIAPSLFAFGVLSLVAVIGIMVYQYRTEMAKGKSLEDLDMLLPSSGSKPLPAEAAKGLRAGLVGVPADMEIGVSHEAGLLLDPTVIVN